MTRPQIDLEVERAVDHLLVRWRDRRSQGEARFDRIPDAHPEWLGSADDLLEGADRRAASAILDSVAAWAAEAGVEIGIWHDGGGVEILDAG